MPRLVDAEKLAKYKADCCCVSLTEWQQGWNDAIDTIIDEAPTVDAVEVVRCKDCIYREVQVDLVYRYEICGIRNEIINLNGFCHMGKRREDAD